MKSIALALVALGIAALIFGLVGYDRQKVLVKIGSLRATATEHKTVPLASVAGAVAIVGGVAILAAGRRRA